MATKPMKQEGIPDSIHTKERMEVTIALGEGPLALDGPRNSLQGIYLDGTPLENRDGTKNFPNVGVDWRGGHSSQGAMGGLADTSSTRLFNVPVTHGGNPTGNAVTRTTEHADSDRITVVVSFPRGLYQIVEDKGWTDGYKCDFTIQYSPSGQNNFQNVHPWATINTMVGIGSSHVWATYAAVATRIRWEVATPNGPYGAPPPVVSIEYQKNETGFKGLTSLQMQYVDSGRGYAYGWTNFSGEENAWYSFRCLSRPGGQQVVATLVENSGYPNSIRVDGKATSEVRLTYEFAVDKEKGPYDVRLTRWSQDDKDTKFSSLLHWYSMTETQMVNLQYPYTAYLTVSFDAQTFPTPPEVSCDVMGLQVLYPNNYNPHSKTYSGVWNGGFVYGWCDNPVWVFRDIILNSRYGLGDYLGGWSLNVWRLYEIAQWCDQWVKRPNGGWERRHEIGLLVLNSRRQALSVLETIASIFDAVPYYGASQVGLMVDMPTDVSRVFANANVIDSKFTYSTTPKKDRHSTCLVRWNDPDNFYRSTVYNYLDRQAVAKYGLHQLEVIAPGCTTETRAARIARRLLYNERNETTNISFEAGLDASFVLPGDVIAVQDDHRAGVGHSGRVVGVSGRTITLDKDVRVFQGTTYTILLTLPTGEVFPARVVNQPGVYRALTVKQDLPQNPQIDSVWILNQYMSLWRVYSVTPDEETETVSISGRAYLPWKYAELDSFAPPFRKSYTSIIPANLRFPRNIQVTEALRLDQGRVITNIFVSWEPSPGATSYLLSYTYNNGPSSVGFSSSDTNYEFTQDMPPGRYVFSLIAVGPLRGSNSAKVSKAVVIQGKLAPPSDVAWLKVTALPDGTRSATWPAVKDLDLVGYELRYSPATTTPWSQMIPLHSGVVTVSPWEFNDLIGGWWKIGIKAKDSSGKYSQVEAETWVRLPNPRVRNVVLVEDDAQRGWPEATTYVDPVTNTVTAASSLEDTPSFDDLSDVSFDEGPAWIESTGTLVYERDPYDFGSVVTIKVYLKADYTGDQAIMEVKTSTDGIEWTEYTQDLTQSFLCRYLQRRITVYGTFTNLSSFTAMIDSSTKERIYDDLDSAALPAGQRIGVGDFRLGNQAGMFSKVQYVAVTFSEDGWSYAIVDKDVELGPRVRLYHDGVLSDTTVDIVLKGI